MFCRILSAAIQGISCEPVTIELDISNGMPVFVMVGSVSGKVRESQDRVRTALRNLGIYLPPKRITLNLSPGELKKDGTGFDLPIAAALLTALEQIPAGALDRCLVLGELHLNGETEGVPGVLPSILTARRLGLRTCIIPYANAAEASSIGDMSIIALKDLSELIDYCRNPDSGRYLFRRPETTADPDDYPDFSDIRGQTAVKRAALVCAAGFHNLLLCGPPGSGKSMTAKRIPAILPDLTYEEKIEVSQIYSVAGLLSADRPLITRRPFRAPHYSLSPPALCGGGRIPAPGEITLAHRGVLFLDELPEIPGRTVELLRGPMEDRSILISRSSGSFRFPASFLLVAAMNPCPCGYYPDMNKCTCTRSEIRNYLSRVSQPILDRIDVRANVTSASFADLNTPEKDTLTTEKMKRMVSRAFVRQQERYRNTEIRFNSELPASRVRQFCTLTPEASRLLESAFSRMNLSARAYHRILKLSRTIADLDESDLICETHLSEAFCFRNQPFRKD